MFHVLYSFYRLIRLRSISRLVFFLSLRLKIWGVFYFYFYFCATSYVDEVSGWLTCISIEESNQILSSFGRFSEQAPGLICLQHREGPHGLDIGAKILIMNGLTWLSFSV